MEKVNDFSNYDNEALVRFIERPDLKEAQNFLLANEEMDSRNLPADQLRELVIKVNEEIAYEIIMNEATSEDKLSMHESNFLDNEELRKIYLEQLKKYIQYKDQFKFDVWSYAIGG